MDVITEDKDFSPYPFLIAPAYQLVDENLVSRWSQYAQNGGHLVLSCRTGQKDRRGHLWEAPWASPIYELIGAKIPAYDLLPSPFIGKVQVKNRAYDWGSWADILEPQADATPLAFYADQFYIGNVAAVTRKLGKGTVTYIGVDTFSGNLEKDLLREVFAAAGVPVQNFDNQFLVDWRDGFWVATNFTEKKQTAPIPNGAKILIGATEIDPAGVAVWME